MTERPSSDERDTPRPELSAFLHDRATSLDHEAAPVTADEAARRTIVAATTPQRRWPTMLSPAKVRTSPRSALAAAAVIALIVGALGGFAVGRGSAPKHASVATAAANPPTAESGATTTVPSPTFGGAVSASGSGFSGAAPMTRVFDRKTSEGIDIHAFLQDQSGIYQFKTCGSAGDCGVGSSATGPIPPGVNQCPASSWCPPAECYSTSFVVEAANAGAVGQSWSQAYPLHDVAVVTSSLMFGDAEGSPARGWIVNTGPDVAEVRATWLDGFFDSMAPSNGWAVLAHNGAARDATMTALDASGAVLATLAAGQTVNTQPPSECVPPPPAPPALPPAGAEQPDGPDAARQAITDAYQTVFTHGSDATLNATLMEDPESLKQALETTKSNFPEAVDTVTVTVGDIVFTSKTEAALYFGLRYTGGALFGKQIGQAKFIDGTWKIAHDTMCLVLSWGGGMCDGGSGSSSGTPPTPFTTIPNN